MIEKTKEQSNIPDGWESQKFPDTIDPFRIDRSKQVQANTYKNEGQYPIVDQGQNLIAGWTDDEKAVLKKELPLIIFGDHTRIFKYVDFPFAVGADGTKLIKPKEYLNPRYFYYRLLHLDIPSKGYSRHYKILKEKAIAYPGKPEQKKIAAVLYKIQKAIEVQGKIIESTKELKKAIMQHLFTKDLRGEKTKHTEIGEIPESWELKPISECYDFTKKPRNLSYGDYKEIAFIPMELIPNFGIRSNEYILKSANDISSGTYFETGDILVSKITPCFENGKQCVIDEIPNDFGVATTEVIPIKEIPDMSDKYFLFYYLLKPDVRSYIAVKMEGATGRQRVPIHLLKDLLIPFPSLSEQKKISSIFLAIDRKIDICDSKRNNLQDLFKSMLNKLMTGDIRVNNINIDISEVATNG